MIDKPRTDIQELLRNPKNGKYLKVVARNYSNHHSSTVLISCDLIDLF